MLSFQIVAVGYTSGSSLKIIVMDKINNKASEQVNDLDSIRTSCMYAESS